MELGTNNWSICYRTLNFLYKRMMKVQGAEPYRSWYKITDPGYQCLICDTLVPVDYRNNYPFSSYIEEHGINHLKEKNLLPFI